MLQRDCAGKEVVGGQGQGFTRFPARRLAVGPCKTIQTDGSSPLKTIIPAVKKSP